MASLKSTMDELGLLAGGEAAEPLKIDRQSLELVIDAVIRHLRDGESFGPSEPVVVYERDSGRFGVEPADAAAGREVIAMAEFVDLFSGEEYGPGDNGAKVMAELNDGWIRRYILSELE